MYNVPLLVSAHYIDTIVPVLTSRVRGIMSMPLLCSRDGRVLRNSRMSTITYQVTTIENVYMYVALCVWAAC